MQGYARMTSGVSQESCQDWGFTGLGGVFSVEWIHKESLPFTFTQHILNPWNDNKRVQVSRDGQVRLRHELCFVRCGVLGPKWSTQYWLLPSCRRPSNLKPATHSINDRLEPVAKLSTWLSLIGNTVLHSGSNNHSTIYSCFNLWGNRWRRVGACRKV